MKLIWSGFSMILLALLVPAGCAAPGDILWQHVLGGPADEEWGYSVDITPDGGILATGSAYSEDLNITNVRGGGDLWVVRLDKDGQILWDRAYGGNQSDHGLSIKATADGGGIIVGTTGSQNGDITRSYGNGDLWVVRISPEGEMLWNQVFGGNMTDEGGDVLLTPDGGYLVIGYTLSDDGDPVGHRGKGDLWMFTLDANGSMVWQKTYGGSERDGGSSGVQTSDGGYAITGNTYSTDGDVTENKGGSDLWVLKTDLNGTLLWQRSYGGSKLDWGHAITELPGGDLIIAGVTSSADGDVSQIHGAADVWILRLNPQGDVIWEKTFGGSYGDNVWKIEPSPRGGIYVVGESASVDGDLSENHGDMDLWIAEIADDGTLLWSRTLGGSQYESGSWLALHDEDLILTGLTYSPDGDVQGYRGGGDFWLMKVNGHFNATLPITGPVPDGVSLPAPSTEIVSLVISENTSVPSHQAIPLEDNLTALVPGPDIPTSPASASEASVTANETVNVSDIIPSDQVPPSPDISEINTTSALNLSVLVIPGNSLPPGDLNNDGLYEDLNGNGKVDLQDPTIFFTNIDWIKEHQPVSAFDYNKNGGIDMGDIMVLFEEVSG